MGAGYFYFEGKGEVAYWRLSHKQEQSVKDSLIRRLGPINQKA